MQPRFCLHKPMARPRTLDTRTQLAAQIDKDLAAQVQRLWHESDRKRWEVVEEIVRLGVSAYEQTYPRHRRDKVSLFDVG